ncbi:ABC transporter ATP-binding protein [Frankia sp. AvcI1]|uniref:ABC transporter ATP-binding protein n=1 Tax=Frankia sp. AvcI1 TaxID=573496 RepID=UPI002118F251|nr:ATP-binding cassette domain-containing protein [Frankia sp. AvcI1]
MTRFGVHDLTVQFGGLRALDQVSFAVEPATFVGLIGPNGAGKTTFMDAVTGFTPATGTVTFEGHDLSRVPAHRRIRTGIGRTFQTLELFEDLTVRENLTAAAEKSTWWSPLVDLVRPRPSRAAAEAVEDALSRLRIEDLADVLPPDLSLGQRKFVTVARALALRPRLLLLDEPAAGLGTSEALAFAARLRELVEEGLTIIMIDHDMGMVLKVCDEIHVLDFGRLIASGDPEAIRQDPRVIQAYLGVDDDPAAAEAAEAAVGPENGPVR